MGAIFRVWLIISTQLVLTNCVFHIHEPNFPKVIGTSNEYQHPGPSSSSKGVDFSLVCDGPVLMRWKVSGLMASHTNPTVDVVFHRGGYRATLTANPVNIFATGFFTCEAHEEKHRQSNPAISIYVYVSEPDLTAYDGHLIPPYRADELADSLIRSSLRRPIIQVEDTFELNKSKCAKLLIPCRVSYWKAEITLKGETYDNQTKFFPDATYDGKRGFSLTYCNNTIKAFFCGSMGIEVEFAWKPLIVNNWNHIYPFQNVSFNVSCVGDSTITFNDILNSSQVLVQEIFPQEDKLTHTATMQFRETKKEGIFVVCKDTKTTQEVIIIPSRFDQGYSYNRECKLYTCFHSDEDDSINLTNLPCLNLVDCEIKKEQAQMYHTVKEWDEVERSGRSNNGARFKGGRTITLDPFPVGFFYCRNYLGGHINSYFTGIDGFLYFLDHDNVPETAVISFNWKNSPFYLGLDTQMSINVEYSTYILAPWATVYVRDGLQIKELERLSPSQGFRNLSLLRPYLKDPNLAITVNTFDWNFSPEAGMIELIFCVQMLNETGQRNFSSGFEVEVGIKPEITNNKYIFDYYHGESGSFDINCCADGNPMPKISWRRISSESNTTQQVFRVLQDQLIFPAIVPEIAGQYECTAFNSRHNLSDSKIFTITTRDRPFDWKILLWIFTSGFLVLCLVVSICVYYNRREQNLTKEVRNLTLKEVEDFFKGAALSTKPFFRQQVDAAENAVRMPYNDIFEIDPDDLVYDTSNLIGQGAFGMVFKATMGVGMKTVAVKTVHENVGTQVFKATLSELKILMYVGYHPHIVEFLGAITTDIEKLDVKLVLEYCDNGDMNKHLRKMLRNGLDLDKDSCSQDEITKQFLKWLVGIGFGLEHLTKRKIIHGDLATRNILLNSNLDPKITDFGLSSKSTDYSAYVKKGTNEPLPWRWMALESLTRFTFSSASDVWSFGVTAWEIFSFGNTPYPNCTWNESFVENLHNGIRLPKPENCADEIFEEILSCWTENVKVRADISSLKTKFQEILNRMP